MTNRQFQFFCKSLVALLLAFSTMVVAQDGKMYPIDAPKEPSAIALGTGDVEGQTASESWFRQWGDPMARNISKATLTPVLADPEKANGTSPLLVLFTVAWEPSMSLKTRPHVRGSSRYPLYAELGMSRASDSAASPGPDYGAGNARHERLSSSCPTVRLSDCGKRTRSRRGLELDAC